MKHIIILIMFSILIIWIGLQLNGHFVKSETKADKEDSDNILEYYTKIYYPDKNSDTTFADETGAELLKISYEVEKVEIQKNVSDNIKNNNFYTDVIIDNGTIANNYSLVVISVSVKNRREIEAELTLNTNRVNVFDEGQCIESYEAIYMSPSDFDSESSQLFHVNLHTDEIRNEKIYYVIDDKYLENNYDLFYQINPSGLDPDNIPGKNDDSSKYIASIELKPFFQ